LCRVLHFRRIARARAYNGGNGEPYTTLHWSAKPSSTRRDLRHIVPTVRTARPTVPFAVTRRHATTMSLCTSRPAQCGYKPSMSHLQARRRLGTPVEGTLENALQGRERPLAQSGVLRDPRSQLLDGLERTTRLPTSSPTTRHHTITTKQPFHVQRVGNAGGELLRQDSPFHHRQIRAPRWRLSDSAPTHQEAARTVIFHACAVAVCMGAVCTMGCVRAATFCWRAWVRALVRIGVISL
jgi:hypothetical protein